MSAIHTGDLRAEGLNGLGTILEFRLEEMPGAHSTAMMACRVDTGKAAGLPGEPVCDRTITIYRAGADRPVYSGMIRRGSVTEENGVQTMRLDLVSGTIRMDLAKKDRSWQDTGMSYGALFRQVAARAGAGVLYPSYLDSRPLGTPRVQYQETDWEFLKRMAGHFGLPLYPERPEAGPGYLSESRRPERRWNWNGRSIRQWWKGAAMTEAAFSATKWRAGRSMPAENGPPFREGS